MGAGRWSSRLGSSGRSPYTEDDEAYTTRFTCRRRAASSTCSVPFTLLSLAPSGSFTERGTERMAAWWNTTAAPSSARSTSSSRRMSPRTICRREAAVRDVGRRLPAVAGLKVVLDPVLDADPLALQAHAPLLVGVRVHGRDGVRLQRDDGQHRVDAGEHAGGDAGGELAHDAALA